MSQLLKYSTLLDLLDKGKISNQKFQQSADEIYQKNWFEFLNKMLLVLGISLTLSGIISFFAFNWEKLDNVYKLLVIQLGLILNFAGYYFKKNDLIKQAFLFASSMMVGVFMASFGILYQLQADSYTLFLNWALAILPWAILSRYYSITALILALLYISGMLYMFDSRSFFLLADNQVVIFNFIYFSFILAFVQLLRYTKCTKLSKNFIEEKLCFIALLSLCLVFATINPERIDQPLNIISFAYLAGITAIGFAKKNTTLVIAVLSILLFCVLKYLVVKFDNFVLALFCLLPIFTFILVQSKQLLIKIWETK